MRIPIWSALALACGAVSFAQSAQKMGSTSILVFGAVPKNQELNFVARGGGFFIDSRHVVSNFEDCCGKTDNGVQMIPVVIGADKDDSAAAKPIFADADTEIAIIELAQSLNHPGVTLSPGKLQQKGQAVYSVQYPKPGDKGSPQVVEGKITGTGTFGDKKLPLFTTSISLNPNNAGGALYDACANVIGINLLVKEGDEYAFVIDPLIDALRSAGLQPNVTDQPCGGSSNSSTGSGDGTQQPKEGTKEGTKDGTKQGKQAPRWRMPQGNEWVPVGIVAVLIVLAFRPARRKVAQVVTGRYAIPQPAPYPGVPAYPGPAAPPVPMPAPLAMKPVLKGVAGQYAGASFPLESGSSTLGRDPNAANLVFAGDATSVSKRHCSVRWDAGRGIFLLEDHGSTNGTFLASGERLIPNQLRELHPGDRFYIGDLRNQFEVAMEP